MKKTVLIRVDETTRDTLNEIALATGETQIAVVDRLARHDLLSRYASDAEVAEGLRRLVKKDDQRSDEALAALLPVRAHVSQIQTLRRLWQ